MTSFRVILCRELAPYYEAVAKEHLPSVQVSTLPYFCLNPLRPGREMETPPALTDIPEKGYLICSPLCPLSEILSDGNLFPVLPPCRSHPLPVLSPGRVSELEALGAFFVTPCSLPPLLATVLGQEEAGRKIFGERTSVLVYIAENGECPAGLETLSDLTGLPCRTVEADRGYIRLILERLLADAEVRSIGQLREKDLEHFQKHSADYGAMLSIIGRLTRSDSEETVLSLLQEALQGIFGAGKIAWHDSSILEDPCDSGSMAAAFREDPRRRYAVTPITSGFWVRVTHSDETLGFLEVGDFRLAEYQQSYLEFTLNICQVIGLSLSNARSFEKLQRNEERFRHFSLHDPLTRLGNRFSFNRTVKEAKNERRGGPYAIMVCDMDGLKEINDTLGHPAGDRAIIAMANILKGALRDSDNLARIGGDEFAAVIGGCSEDVIKTIGTRIQRAIVESNENRDEPFSVEFSVGFCLAEGSPPDLENAFRLADDRMYAAKRAKKAHPRRTAQNTLAGL